MLTKGQVYILIIYSILYMQVYIYIYMEASVQGYSHTYRLHGYTAIYLHIYKKTAPSCCVSKSLQVRLMNQPIL